MNKLSKNRLFDDPVSNLKSWLLHHEQKRMRSVIGRKYEGILDPQVYWITGTDTEHDGLSSEHLERMVQRLSLSQIGVFLAQRIWAKRTWLLMPTLLLIGLLLAYILLNKAGTTTSDTLIPPARSGSAPYCAAQPRCSAPSSPKFFCRGHPFARMKSTPLRASFPAASSAIWKPIRHLIWLTAHDC